MKIFISKNEIEEMIKDRVNELLEGQGKVIGINHWGDYQEPSGYELEINETK